MVGIYNDDFVKYLKRHLGSNNVKITTKNIVIPCLWCEFPKQKDHYHLHIGLDEPIYNCFHGGCGESGTIKKLLNEIHGYDITGRFVDKKHFEDLKQKRLEKVEKLYSKFTLPPLEADRFPLKRLSLKKRMKFLDLPLERIEGLILQYKSGKIKLCLKWPLQNETNENPLARLDPVIGQQPIC